MGRFHPFDFVDCLLIAYHKVSGCDIFTFDMAINKYVNNRM